MRQKIVIASFGGSGSTFITNEVKRLLPESLVYHTHATPRGDFLGIPTLNEFTGHAEGPLSNSFPLSDKDKVILICRKPAEAYLSRACFKHFCHIWFGHELFEKVLGEDATKLKFEECQVKFNEKWKLFQDENRDILHLDQYLKLWLNFATKKGCNILFLKYESLNNNLELLSEFIGKKGAQIKGRFEPRKRFVSSQFKNMFENADRLYTELPSAKLFSNKETNVEYTFKRIDVNSTFTVNGLDAGLGDSFSRLEVVYDFVKCVSNMNYEKSSYVNYHAKDVDFIDLFNISGSEEGSAPEKKELISIDFSMFVNLVLRNKDFLKNDKKYVLRADMYENDSRLQYAKNFLSIEPVFFGKIRCNEKMIKNPFAMENSFKVVFHLRRSDILRDQISPFLNDEEMVGIHSRPILESNDAMLNLDEFINKHSITKHLEIM